MKKITCVVVALMFLVLPNEILAQDYQFSQFFNAPVLTNPALTGKVNGFGRIALNYRNQWFNVADKPFITYAGSFDAPIVLKNDDAIGLGLAISNDQTNNGVFNQTQILASVAYHKALGRMAKHSLSLGLQGGYIQKRLDINNVFTFDQFNPDLGTFDPNIPSGDNFTNSNSGNFDFNLGLLVNHIIGKKINLYYGFSMSHVFEPKESFNDNSEYAVPRKFLGHLGMEYSINKWFKLLPSLIYVRQLGIDQFNAGLSGGFNLTGGVVMYAGGYYRIVESFGASDAAILYVAFEYKGLNLGFSYDGTVSSLNNTPKPTGAFEMSLGFTIPGKGLPDVSSLLFCPRF